MVWPSWRHALTSKKSTSSFLDLTRLTASPKEQTGMPSLVKRTSGSLVRLPARTTRLKLTMGISLPCSYLALVAPMAFSERIVREYTPGRYPQILALARRGRPPGTAALVEHWPPPPSRPSTWRVSPSKWAGPRGPNAPRTPWRRALAAPPGQRRVFERATDI